MSPEGGGVPPGSADTALPLARYVQVLGAGLCVALGLALLIDYGDALLRGPQAIGDLPFASKPVAAASILLLGLSAWVRPEERLAWRIAAQAAIGVAILLLAAHVSDQCFGSCHRRSSAALRHANPP